MVEPRDVKSLFDLGDEAMVSQQESLAYYLKNLRDRAAKQMQDVDRSRLAMLLLAGDGVDFSKPTWSDTNVRVNLGQFRQTKRDQKALLKAVRKVRVALGCRLELQPDVDQFDAKRNLVQRTFRPVDFPDVAVTFVTNLPKKPGVKCAYKKVRVPARTEVRLVCA